MARWRHILPAFEKEAAQEGLFLCGCDSGAAGMGTHQATMSGMVVADLVMDRLGVTGNL